MPLKPIPAQEFTPCADELGDVPVIVDPAVLRPLVAHLVESYHAKLEMAADPQRFGFHRSKWQPFFRGECSALIEVLSGLLGLEGDYVYSVLDRIEVAGASVKVVTKTLMGGFENRVGGITHSFVAVRE